MEHLTSFDRFTRLVAEMSTARDTGNMADFCTAANNAIRELAAMYSQPTAQTEATPLTEPRFFSRSAGICGTYILEAGQDKNRMVAVVYDDQYVQPLLKGLNGEDHIYRRDHFVDANKMVRPGEESEPCHGE